MTTELTLEAGQLTSAYAETQGSRAFLVIHVDEPGRPSWVVELTLLRPRGLIMFPSVAAQRLHMNHHVGHAGKSLLQAAFDLGTQLVGA